MGVDDIGDKGGGPASDLYIDSKPPPPPADTHKTDPLVTARSTSMVKLRRMMFEDITRTDDEKPPPTKRSSGLMKCELISDERDEQPNSACSDKESGKSSDKLGHRVSQSDCSIESNFSAGISYSPVVESDKNNAITEKEASDIGRDLNEGSLITSVDCTLEIIADQYPENSSQSIELGEKSESSHPVIINKSEVTQTEVSDVSSQSKLPVALENNSSIDLSIVQATNELLNNFEDEIEYNKLVESKESILVEATNDVVLDESAQLTSELDLTTADCEIVGENKSKEKEEVLISNREEDLKNEDEFTSLTNNIEQLVIAAANEELIKAHEEKREMPKKNDVTDKEDEISEKTVCSEPKTPVPTERIVKHKPPIPKSTKTHVETDKIKPSDDYPDDLNPFGDDDDEEGATEVKKDHSKSLNPFGSSDEEEDAEKEEPVKLTPPKPKERKVVPAPKSLNPFWSGDEEEEEESLPPVPKPRKLRTPQLSPEPSPRRLRPATGSLGSATSLASRKKKPAPPPPNVQTSTGTLSSRKSYSAPKPPPAASPPPPLPASSPPSSPLLTNNDNDSFSYFNPTRRNSIVSTCSSVSSAISYTPHKSTYGQWKRKKGPAPARPVPVRRAVPPMPLAAVRQELADIEIKQQGLERQGVKLEQTIRDKFEQEGATISSYVEEMVLQLFELVNEKNELFRRQAELMYLRRQHNLEEEHAELEYQIRCLMLCPERNKTDSDKAREDQLIQRLVEVVERRNEIVDCLEMDRLREREEDDSIGAQLGIFSAAVGSEVDLRTKSDKKSKKSKEKKEKRWSRKDVDTESEESGQKKKSKKKWFTLPRHSAHKS